MNNKQILDLTLRLSQSLDENYDVVNMDTVLSVIMALEGATITKEQLEATRLAKYINQLRRRTKCENLARRAKSLLKKWREMVGIQQSNESSATSSVIATTPTATAITISSAASTPYNMPVCDNAVSTSHLTNSHQHHQRQAQFSVNVKQHEIQQQPYHSQPSSPINLHEKSNPNEFLMSISNPATGSHMPKSSSVRKKRRIDKSANSEPATLQQQPTSFANLLTGLGSALGSTRKTTRDKPEPEATAAKPVETYIIEHSSNSNSDLICLPSNNNASDFISTTNVPPVVIDLQDTNSSMNSLVSKDVTNSSSFCKTKPSTKKSKKDKKRKDKNITARQNQSLQDCDDHNTGNVSYQHKRPSDVLILEEKSHSACPTISNISEILSLSNSSMSSVFPSTDAISKNIFQSAQSELTTSSSAKMSKADLTFAGKFKQNTSSVSGGSNVLNYNTDSMNVNILSSNSPNQNKFSLFGGIGTNSNDSTSNSRTSQFNVVVDAIKRETSDSKHNIDDVPVKHDINEKSISDMSNKGNSSTDNAFAVGASATMHQQSIDLTTMDFSSQQTIKQPKKRGRKKGSKGVDSVIAKETSLSTQMLISSLSVAGKKVKTTKELYAEMENRKLRNVTAGGFGEVAGNLTSNWCTQQQQQKPVAFRRTSFCSDLAESDSCTMTSEPSRDSGNILNKTVGKSETPLDNNSNCSKHDTEKKIGDIKGNDGSKILINQNSTLAMTSNIKQEIQEILKLLSPPPSVKEIEYESFNSITPCTCTIEEVIVPAKNDSNVSSGENNITDSNFNTTNSTNIIEKEINRLKIEHTKKVKDNVKVSGKDQKDSLCQVAPAVKMKKSIFDLDFDEDEDPLNTIIADIVGKNSKADTIIISPPVVDKKSEIPLGAEDDLIKVDQQNAPYALNVPTTPSDNIIVFPSYEIKFDLDCKAKNRFEVQTQKITKFHIDTLHNCFIPNVNGNWNHADFMSNRKVLSKNDQDDEERLNKEQIIDGYDVVPLYGSHVNEQIVKNLSQVKFTKNYKVKMPKCKTEIFHTPFLGVTRIPDMTDDKVNLSNKNIKTLKLDEEKENAVNKINLNNIFHESALETIEYVKNKDTLIPNENDGRDAKEMERLQNVDSSIENNNIKCGKQEQEDKGNQQILTLRPKRLKKKRTKRKRRYATCQTKGKLKLHNTLFFHEEIYPMDRNRLHFNKEYIFQISSCSSCCSGDEEVSIKKRTTSTLSSSSSSSSPECSDNKYQGHMLNMQQEIIQKESLKRTTYTIEKDLKSDSLMSDSARIDDSKDNDDDLPEDNNRMLLSFNNIYNKDHESNMLKQQQNCDDYINLNKNFNLIKYNDNKTSSVNNIININNNNNSCSNNYSDTNIIISSSSCSHENPINSNFIQHKNLTNNNNNVQIKPLKEYQTGIRAVDEDVNDDEGNNCGRLQQFKEWHEVLQLRSYNEELLTVLPYVVLE